MPVSLELFMNLGKIGSGPALLVDAPRRRPVQRLFHLAILPACGQRPGDPGRLGAPQILMDGRLSDRTTAGDLPLPQFMLEAESQNFLDLSHGQPLHGQCWVPSTFQWNLTAPVVVQRPSPNLPFPNR